MENITEDMFQSMSADEKWKVCSNFQSKVKLFLSLDKKLDVLVDKFEKLESELSVSKAANHALKEDNVALRRRLNRLEQYGRQENVIISGIPDSVEDKNLEKCAIKLMAKLKVRVYSSDIVDCHRLKKRGTGIIRFVNRKNARDAISNSRSLKDVDTSDIWGVNATTYVSMNLIPEYLSLRFQLKNLKAEAKIFGFGTNKRGLWAKVSATSQKKQIEVEEDIIALVN